MKNSLTSALKFLTLIFFSLFLFNSCTQDSLERDEKSSVDLTTANAKDNNLIEGQYIVVLSTLPGKKNSRALEALETLTKEVGQMPEAQITRKYTHALTGFAAKLTDKQFEKLNKDPRVEKIEKDSYMYPSGELSVQQYPDWGLDRIDQRENTLDQSYYYTASGSGVTAYLVDTGIRFAHTEFEERASNGRDFVLESEPENTDPLQKPGEDCWDHGTSVAAVLGGAQSGVAKNVKLVSVRVWGCQGGSPRSRILAAVDWITEKAILPAVVNMGGSHADSLIAIAIENSTQKGIVYVGVAGNQSEEIFPVLTADRSGILTVGASDINDKRAAISNFGNGVDLYAPGEAILSASNKDDISFAQYTGTSMSSPFVAGVAALFLELYPEATPAQIKTEIIKNSTPNAIADVPYGGNDLLYSIWGPDFIPETPTDLMLAATGEKVRSNYVANLTWNTTSSQFLSIYIDDSLQSYELINDGEEQIILPNKGRDATYLIQICDHNYDNCSEEVILIFGSGGLVNNSPSAGFSFSINILDVQFNDSSTVTDGSIMDWFWDFGDETSSSEQNPNHSFSQSGTYSVSLTVWNKDGNSDSITKNIIVGEEEPNPEENQLSATGYKVKGQWRTDLTWAPSNPDQMVDIYRNGSVIATVTNTGSYTDITNEKGGGSLTYKICESGTNSCSNEVTVQF